MYRPICLFEPNYFLPMIVIPIPPRINAAAITRRRSATSDKNQTPIAAAMIGTANCNTAARVEVWCFNAAYQTAYPTTDVTAPEITASKMPRFDR